jgi:hypothetical protein
MTPFDIAQSVEQNAIPGSTLVSPVQQTGIVAKLGLQILDNAFVGASSGTEQTGVEIFTSSNSWIERCTFEGLTFGIRYFVGTANPMDDIVSNTFRDNMYGLFYTGVYTAPGPTSTYNPRLHCNQFEKTYPGLPWATGILLHTGARIQQIGGNGSFPTFTSPSGNGWVGLVPANQGYAIHNTSTGHLVDYFAYSNEIISSGQLVNAMLIQTAILAEPFIDPLTLQQNPNATCFENPAVFFLRGTSDVTISQDIELLAQPFVKAYPNPAHSDLYVEVDEKVRDVRATFILKSVYGETVRQIENIYVGSDRVRLELDSCRPGVYYLEYVFEGVLSGTLKIVKL